MIVAKLKISYDRGIAHNRASDLGANVNRGDVLADGKVVRGLGSHFRSEAEAEAVKLRDKEAGRIYRAFRERFMTTMVDGLYIVPGAGVAQKFVDSLNPVGVVVRVIELQLTGGAGLDDVEVAEWSERIRRQLLAVSLGRKKNEVNDHGLRVLGELADCPLVSEATRNGLKGMVDLLRTAKIDRGEFKKRLGDLNIEIEIEQMDKAHAERVEQIKGAADWAHARVPEAPQTPAVS